MKSADLKTLLWASIEDYCGLWELVWELNALHPHNSLQENQYMALQGTLYCLSKDLMALFYCQEPYGKVTKVKVTGSYDDFLQDPKIWQSPSPGTQSVRVSATKLGEKYYNNILAYTPDCPVG